MEGCGKYGFPVFDTTQGQFRVQHFLIEDVNRNISNYNQIYDCINTYAVTSWYHLAEEWTVTEFDV